jgi:endonuclease YncB( thermonuclease family)
MRIDASVAPVALLRPALVAVTVLLLGACGGGSETAMQTTATTQDQPPVSDTGSGDSGSDDSPDPSATTGAASGPDVKPAGEVALATVVRVSDGDSFNVRLESGAEETVRMVGINANEADTCFGPEAGDRLAELIADREVELVLLDERDDFDRLLAYVFVDDQNVNLTMVREAMVVARDQSGHELAGVFEQAETDAKAGGSGMWASDACGESSGADVFIGAFESNARGPDDENRNGEFVTLVNGGDAVDLAGWSVRDESTRHRFEFGEATLGSGQLLCVYSGAEGEPVDEPCGGTSYYWDADGSVWNNGGDTIFVLDPNGNIVDSISYTE